MESVAIPIAQVVSHINIRMVGECGCPRSAKIVQRLAACWAPANRAEYSAFPALATMQGMMVKNV